MIGFYSAPTIGYKRSKLESGKFFSVLKNLNDKGGYTMIVTVPVRFESFSYKIVSNEATRTTVVECSGNMSTTDVFRMMRGLRHESEIQNNFNQLFDLSQADFSDIPVKQFHNIMGLASKFFAQSPSILKIALFATDPIACGRAQIFKGMSYRVRFPELNVFNNKLKARHWLVAP